VGHDPIVNFDSWIIMKTYQTIIPREERLYEVIIGYVHLLADDNYTSLLTTITLPY